MSEWMVSWRSLSRICVLPLRLNLTVWLSILRECKQCHPSTTEVMVPTVELLITVDIIDFVVNIICQQVWKSCSNRQIATKNLIET